LRPEYCRIIRDISFASVSQKVMEACGKLIENPSFYIGMENSILEFLENPEITFHPSWQSRILDL
jgi:hypothetical protein